MGWPMAVGAAGIVILAVLVFVLAGRVGGCASHDDVAARVAWTSSKLQQAAARGKIKVEELASGIKRLNDAATAYNSTQDHQTYCDALYVLGEEYKLAD